MLDSGEEYKTNLENVIVDWVINLNRKSHKELLNKFLKKKRIIYLLSSKETQQKPITKTIYIYIYIYIYST